MSERKILENSIKDHQTAIDKAKAELKELDKPKLEHLDLLHWHKAKQSGTYGVLDLSEGRRTPHMLWPSKPDNQDRNQKSMACIEECCTKVGNIKDIFDDLALNSKDLEEFEVKSRRPCGDTFKLIPWTLSEGADFDITFRCERTSMHHPANEYAFSFADVQEIHQKLGQVICTQIRKQNG